MVADPRAGMPAVVHILTGPTASGKSAVARCLARMLDAEIVVADSMKLYRGMDVGTAKPPVAHRLTTRYWMMDVAEPWESFTLARYLRGAESAMAATARSGRCPLVAGGTPMYLRGLLYGLFDGPSADWSLRERLQQRASRVGVSALHAELARVDSAAAARIHPNDMRRVVRALEVHRHTGVPISDQQQQFSGARMKRPAAMVVLERSRDALRTRIRRRVERMFAQGLVAEVERLVTHPQGLGRSPRQAVGYKEVIEHLEGKHSREEAAEAIVRSTWRLARKQMTWFRSFPTARWLRVPVEETPLETAHRVRECWRAKTPASAVT